MTDQIADRSKQELFSDESTRTRWDWVHKAISLAKHQNHEKLVSSEARQHRRVADIRLIGR